MKRCSTNRMWGRLMAWMLAAALLFTNLEGAAVVRAEGAKAAPVEIGSAEDLLKIGSNAAYPMTGDYVLTDDIDLSGADWTPFGGYKGNKGSCNPQEANVFSGTFDGQGHVISGLKIDLDGPIESGQYGQVGFFSVVGSDSADDYAEVKNLIFTDVNIHTDFANTAGSAPLAAVGTLAGEVNGYARISNIAILSGELNINNLLNCNTVGAGGLIGECRTENTAIGNGHIFVTDIYNGADVRASGTEERLEYAGGIIGRVAKSACGEISRCVNTGEVLYCGYDGYGIISAESANIAYAANLSDSYFRAVTEQRAFGNVTALSDAELTGGTLPEGLAGGNWRAEEGAYPVPSFCYESSAAGLVYLSGVSLGFAEKESASGVKTEITLPLKAGEHVLTWTSSNPEALEVSAGTAVAHRELLGTDTVVKLTAETPKAVGAAENYSRSFQVTVLAGDDNKPSFQPGYATVGQPLSVSIPNAQGQLTYQWRVDNQIAGSEDKYTPKEEDLEKFISVSVTEEGGKHWDLSMYCSELPVVYVDTNDGEGITNKNIPKDAVIRIQGNAEFNNPDMWYQGETTIKGRGNSTWDYAYQNSLKLPYKLKLGSKANLLGIGSGANKHWTLLANIIDHTNMRNEVAHKFAKGVGMETTVNDTGVVLVLNGKYQGMYELSEHVRVGSARVNVFEWEELADDIAKAVCKQELALDRDALEVYLEENLGWMSGSFSYMGKSYRVADYYTDPIPDCTGGFLLDMDFRSVWDEVKYISRFQTKNGIPMFFRAPEYAKTNQAMVDYAKGYLDAYEEAIGSPDFTAAYKGETVHYTDLFDMDSLLQYWLLCEYVNNWDSMKNSSYLYKDLQGKAKMGPAWDYDWAWGNINMYNNSTPFVYDQWHTTLCGQSPSAGGFAEQEYQKEQWHRYLVKDPYFVTRAWEYYQKYRDTLMEDIMKDGGLIDGLEEKYASSSEANDAKWSGTYRLYSGKAFVNGVEQSGVQGQTYHEAVASLKTFITKRMEWMDRQFTDVQTLYASLGNTVSSQISVAAPAVGADGTVTATADVKDANATSVVFLVNGKKILVNGSANIPVSNGKASVTVDSAAMLGNMLNTIEVLGVNSAGSYISGLMNFTTFEGPEVALEGTVQVSSDRAGDVSYAGDKLTAEVTLAGEIKGNLTYQWYAGEEAITGATKASYQLTRNEIGKTVSVRVASTVESGTITQSYAGTVNEKPTVLEGTVKISAEPQREGNVSYPGDTLKAKVSDDTNTGELIYQWYADGEKIKGATKKSYVLTDAEIGKVLSIKVKSDEQSGTLEQTYAGTVTQNPNPDTEPAALTGTITVTADPQREGNVSYPGDTLTAALSADSNNTGTLGYQWYAAGTAITGATEASYELTDAEIGKKVTVQVTSSVESGTLEGTFGGTVTQKPAPEPDNLTGTVTVTASPEREGNVSYPGDTLTAALSADSNNTGTLSYQWYAAGTLITGATEASYVLTDAETDKKITVKVISSVQGGTLEGAYVGTVVKDPGTEPGPGPEEPAELTGTVTVTSSRSGAKSYPGDTLNAEVSEDNNSGDFSYQWYAGESEIAGATEASYVLTSKEIGKKLTVEVTSSVETGKLTGTYEGSVVKKPVKPTGIAISVKSKKMYAYQTMQLKATVKPKGASQKVTYSMDKKSVVKISKTGLITAKAPGKVKITVKSADANKVKATVTITVQKPTIKVSGKLTVKPKKSISLTAKPYGVKGTVKWKLDAKGKNLLRLNKPSGTKVKLTAKTKTGTAKLTISCGKTKVTKTIRIKK